jgi:hypothetical protein
MGGPWAGWMTVLRIVLGPLHSDILTTVSIKGHTRFREAMLPFPNQIKVLQGIPSPWAYSLALGRAAKGAEGIQVRTRRLAVNAILAQSAWRVGRQAGSL